MSGQLGISALLLLLALAFGGLMLSPAIHKWEREAGYPYGKKAMDDILAELAANDGACLYWQMVHGQAALEAVKAGKLVMIDDLVIHPDAIEIERGMAYRMP